MKAVDYNTTLIDNYFGLLKGLSSDDKLELIARLSKSMKSSQVEKDEVSLDSLYGSWISEETADELVAELKNARNFSRKREEL
jgi:hypothetical protein